MATKPELIVDIRPTTIESAYAIAPFDKAKAALEAEGYDIVSLPVNAQLRMQQGKDADVSTKGNYVREGPLYIKGRGNFLVRHSPILESAKEAAEAHRRRGEFYPTQEQTEKALEDSVRFPESNIEIPTNRFGEEELTAWAFGEQAKPYGEFLREAKIKAMPVWVVDKSYVSEQQEPFVKQLWFANLDSRSGLFGYYRGLGCHGGVRGVREMKSAEGAAKITAGELYTPNQISRALSGLGISGLEKQLVDVLRQKH